VDPLGTPSKDNQGTKIGQIIFLGPFSLNVFIFIIFFSCLSISCQSIWLEVSITIKNGGNHYKFVFLIDVALSGIKIWKFITKLNLLK
jgi:hypothetical protein